MILLGQDTIITNQGEFQEHLFYDGRSEVVVLTKGKILGQSEVLCRIHSSCLSAHAFGSLGCDCATQMEFAQRAVTHAQRGIIIWLEQEGRANGHLAKMLAEPLKRQGFSQSRAYVEAGFAADARDYAQASSILKYFRVESVVLMTENIEKIRAVERAGLTVSRYHPSRPEEEHVSR